MTHLDAQETLSAWAKDLKAQYVEEDIVGWYECYFCSEDFTSGDWSRDNIIQLYKQEYGHPACYATWCRENDESI